MTLTSQQEKVLRYNWWTMKLNMLPDNEGLFEFLPRNYQGEVKQEDIDYLEKHYHEMKEILQNL